MTWILTSWLRPRFISTPLFTAIALVMAGGLPMGLAVEPVVRAPSPSPAVSIAAATPNEFDTLLAELAPPGSSAQITAITEALQRGSVAQKERLFIGLGTANMTNARSLVVDHARAEDPVVALAALRACQDLQPSTVEELKGIHEALKAMDPRVQTRAAMVLAHLEDETSVSALINRLGTVTAPEAKSTLSFLHDLSGVDVGETAQPWQTWLDAEVQAADAKIPGVLNDLASKDSEQVMVALKEASTLRVRRSLLVPSILPLMAHADANVARMAELSLKALGGPVAKGALQTWLRERPLAQTSIQAPVALGNPVPEPTTIAEKFQMSAGTQDFLVVTGILCVFFTVFVILGRPTKKALQQIDEATGGHVTRRIVMAKAKGQLAIKNTTTFFKRGAKTADHAPRPQAPTPALERKVPRAPDVAVQK